MYKFDTDCETIIDQYGNFLDEQGEQLSVDEAALIFSTFEPIIKIL